MPFVVAQLVQLLGSSMLSAARQQLIPFFARQGALKSLAPKIL
jgi:hypothetical protein